MLSYNLKKTSLKNISIICSILLNINAKPMISNEPASYSASAAATAATAAAITIAPGSASATSSYSNNFSKQKIEDFLKTLLFHDDNHIAIGLFVETEMAINADLNNLCSLILNIEKTNNFDLQIQYIKQYIEEKNSIIRAQSANKKPLEDHTWQADLLEAAKNSKGGSELKLLKLCAAKLSFNVSQDPKKRKVFDDTQEFSKEIIESSSYKKALNKLSDITKTISSNSEDKTLKEIAQLLNKAGEVERYIEQDLQQKAMLKLSNSQNIEYKLLFMLLKIAEKYAIINNIHSIQITPYKQSSNNEVTYLCFTSLGSALLTSALVMGAIMLGCYVAVSYFGVLDDIKDIINAIPEIHKIVKDIPIIKSGISELKAINNFIGTLSAMHIKAAISNMTLGVKKTGTDLIFDGETAGNTFFSAISNVTGQVINDANTISAYLKALCIIFKCS